MNISDKIKHTNCKEINLYIEGVFWVAYEQSAYYFWKLKGYKPTKRFVKVIGMEVVSVGFPRKDRVAGDFSYVEDNNHLVSELDEEIDMEEFLKWKEGLEIKSIKTNRDNSSKNQCSLESSVTERIKNFDMSQKTPMECMFFLAEIKKIIM